MPAHDRSDAAVQVANLIARYAELIDAGDFEGLASLLGHAGVGGDDGPSLLTGREALRKLFVATTRLYPDGTPGTKHVTTNLIIEIDDEATTAAARSYFTVLQAVPGLPLQPILAGRYRDRFERADGAWRFSERRYLIDLVGDVSQHMLTGLPS
jgi:hypothetical protein